MSVPKFSKEELKIIDVIPESPFMRAVNIYNYPVTVKAAAAGLFNKKPVWQILNFEVTIFTPRICPDFIARAWVNDSRPFDPDTEGGGIDMFGIEWVYVPVALGSMVKPGNPILADANDWCKILKFPNVDEWDWAGSAMENNDIYLKDTNFNQIWIQNGWFERLISFMDFEAAALALVDPEQKDAVKDLFDALSDLYINIIDHYIKYFKSIDAFLIHDDWGSQQSSFFSPAVAREMIVPAMKKVTDHLHKIGVVAELHSCGKIEIQVPNIIEAGWDAWAPQPMNDVEMIHEKFGDRIIIGATPDFLPENAMEEEQRESARAYASKYCDPLKPTYMPVAGMEMLTPAFREELYIQSRKFYDV